MKSKENILEKNVKLLIYLITNFFLLFFLNGYLVHHFGKTTYGQFSLTVSLLTNICPILLFGSYYILTEEIPKSIEHKNKEKLQNLLNWGLNILFTVSFVLFVFSSISILLQMTNIIPCHTSFCKTQSKIYIDGLYFSPLFLIIFWNSQFFLATKEQNLSIILSPVVKRGILFVILSVLSIAYVRTTGKLKIEHTTASLMLFASLSILMILQWIILAINKKDFLNCSFLQFLHKAKREPILAKKAISHVIPDTLTAISNLSIPLPIELAISDTHTLAEYYICNVIGNFASILQQAISPSMYKYFSRAGVEKKITKKLESIIQMLVIAGVLWLFFSISMLFIFKNQILDIYHVNHTKYIMSGIILQMTYTTLNRILCRPMQILDYKNMMKPIYIATIAQMIIQISLSYILVQKMSFIGPIVANIIGTSTNAMICTIAIKSYQIRVRPLGYI